MSAIDEEALKVAIETSFTAEERKKIRDAFPDLRTIAVLTDDKTGEWFVRFADDTLGEQTVSIGDHQPDDAAHVVRVMRKHIADKIDRSAMADLVGEFDDFIGEG